MQTHNSFSLRSRAFRNLQSVCKADSVGVTACQRRSLSSAAKKKKKAFFGGRAASSPGRFSASKREFRRAKRALRATGVFLKMASRSCVSGCGHFLASSDGHDRCPSRLGFQHAEAALVNESCFHCGNMTMAMLRSRCLLARRGGIPLAQPRSSSSGLRRTTSAQGQGDLRIIVRASPSSTSLQASHSSSTSHRLVFPDEHAGSSDRAGPHSISFRAPADDRMSITASGDELGSGEDDSAALPPSGRVALPESDPELTAMLSRAAESIGLLYRLKPPSPECSRLDDWFLGAQAEHRQPPPVPFFPEVHEEVTRSWGHLFLPETGLVPPPSSPPLTVERPKCMWRSPQCGPTGEGRDKAGLSSRDGVRVLQPLLHRTQETRWVTSNLGPACSEPGPCQAPVQDVDAETHLSMRPSLRLGCSDRPERRLLPCLDPPSIPLCVRRASIPVGPPLRAPQPVGASGQPGKEQTLPYAEDLFSRHGVGLGQPHSMSLRGSCSVNAEMPGVSPVQESGSTETFSEAPGAYGILSRYHAARIASYETASALASRPSPEMGMAPRHIPGLTHPVLPPHLQPMVGPCFSSGRSSPRASIQACCCFNRHLYHGLGGHVQRACSRGALDRAPAAVAYQLPRVAGSMACSAPLQNAAT